MCDIKADEVLIKHLEEHSVRCICCGTPMLGIFSRVARAACASCGDRYIESPLEILKRLQIIGN